MKDPFTAALSEIVQNQIELTSVIESVLSHAASNGTAHEEADEIRDMLMGFNGRVNHLTKELAARYDERTD